MKKILVLAAGLVSAVLVGPAAAQVANSQLAGPQDPVANPRSTINYFDEQNVGAILSELGAVWQSGSANGTKIIGVNLGGDINFLMMPAACKGANQTQCVGLAMTALFSGYANSQTVAAFNDRFVFSSTGLNSEGDAYLSRYEISDYGIPRGNVAISILVFVAQAQQFQQELATARQTVSLEGYADDLSAQALNRTGVASLVGVEPGARDAVETHQISLDEAAEHIKFLVDYDGAPRNKIENIKR